MTRRVLLLLAMAVLASELTVSAQSPATEDGLKLAHQTLVAAITSGNPALVEPVLVRNGLGFFKDSQMIVQLDSVFSAQEAIPSVLSDLGRFTMSAYDAAYRVAGMTGVVCMATILKPNKGEQGPPRYIRSTFVYTLLDGTWRLMSWHSSDIPLKK
jgi:hypothetical protein